MTNLFASSVRIILQNQASSGAYVACPNFPTYRYCWFRDGAFIAYAMDLVGGHQSASRFHDWASRTILRYTQKITHCIESARLGIPPSEEECLHSRFTLEGAEGGEEWTNHQLDGFGTWLWSLGEHAKIRRLASLPENWRLAAQLIADYLSALWAFPCYDAWEENGNRIHTHTLAAIYAGLTASQGLSVHEGAQETAKKVRHFILTQAVQDGRLVKSTEDTQIDASLLGVATPYRLLDPHHPTILKTVAQIEKKLRRPGGGVHRYAQDSYYGGGEWILLTAWLGWHYAERGETKSTEALLHWVESQADPTGQLPEQVSHSLNEPSQYEPWVNRWGPIAKPLLWSHAKYLILRQALTALS